MALINRNQYAAYMEVGTETPTYHLIGLGFTNLTESKNPKEYARQYVHEQTERTDVTGFAPAYDYAMDAYSDDPVCLHIMEVHDNEKIGSEAQVNIVAVNKFGGTGTSFPAWKRTYAIIPDNKGDGNDALVYTGTMKAVGDFVAGTFDTATKTFTATAGGGEE